MRHSMRGIVCHARQPGLSTAQIATLFQPRHRNSQAGPEIDDNLVISNAIASQLLNCLMQQEPVMRIENLQDRREKQLILIETGTTSS